MEIEDKLIRTTNNLCIDLDNFNEIQIKINGVVLKVDKDKLLAFIKKGLENE